MLNDCCGQPLRRLPYQTSKLKTMNKLYERVRLPKEYENLLKLQQHPDASPYLSIEYNPRESGNPDEWVPVTTAPGNGLYPYRYKFTYTMPMYVSPKRKVRKWSASYVINASERALIDGTSGMGLQLYGDGYKYGVPFNQHISPGHFCDGNATMISRGMGLWYYAICIGAILNQDAFAMAWDGGHYNPEAHTWWVDRGRCPINKIDWPFNLLDSVPVRPSFTFGEIKAPVQQPAPKFSFGAVSNNNLKSK